MKATSLLSALAWATTCLAGVPATPEPLVGVRVRNFPGKSDAWTIHEIHRRLVAMFSRQEDRTLKNSTSIEKAWNDAVLFSVTHEFDTGNENLTAEVGVEVRCVTCYINAGATVEMSMKGELDVGLMIENVTDQFVDEMRNLTTTTVDTVREFFGDVWEAIEDEDIELSDVSFNEFNIDLDFDIDFPPLPEIQVAFQIDELDVYIELGTKITGAATLTVPLFKSQTPLGYGLPGSDIEIGVFVTADLILSVEGEIDFTTGIHLELDDAAGFRLALFSSNVSDIFFDGAKFEFLPVKVITANAVLKAILRVGMHAGLTLSTPDWKTFITSFSFSDAVADILDVSAGMEMGVFAHIAEFVTNITAGTALEEEEGCKFKLVEEYTLGIGAHAGATVQLLGETWGPQPSFTLPIFYTTLLDACATAAETTPTPTAQIEARQDPNVETRTLTSTERLSAVGCPPSAGPLCPVHLQTTRVQTTTLTHVTTVPPGAPDPTFPARVSTGPVSRIPFGNNVKAVSATEGEPVSFVPPPPPPPPPTTTAAPGGGGGDDGDVNANSNSVDEVLSGQTNGVDNKLIIGLSVGLGVPFLIAVAVAIWFLVKRHRYAPVPKKEAPMAFDSSEYQSPMAGSTEGQGLMKPAGTVGVAEAH